MPFRSRSNQTKKKLFIYLLLLCIAVLFLIKACSFHSLCKCWNDNNNKKKTRKNVSTSTKLVCCICLVHRSCGKMMCTLHIACSLCAAYVSDGNSMHKNSAFVCVCVCAQWSALINFYGKIAFLFLKMQQQQPQVIIIQNRFDQRSTISSCSLSSSCTIHHQPRQHGIAFAFANVHRKLYKFD